MTSYSSTVKEHNVNKEFIPLETLIEGLKKLENLSQDDFTNIVRVEYILNNIQEALKSSDRQLISLSWLNKAYDALKNINSELVNYQSSRNATHLNSNMSPQLDVILEVTANINMVKSKPTLQGVMASINRYQESIEGYLSQIGDQETILKEHIEELSASIKNSNIDLENKIHELNNSIIAEKNRLDGLYQTHQDQISANKEAFQTFQNDSKKELEVLTNELNRKAIELVDTNGKIFDKYTEEVKNIVGIVNTNMFSHKYKEVADDARSRAKFWHIVAMILLLGLVGFAFYAFICTTNQDTSWVKLIAKMFTATTIGTGSAYAIKQASNQEKVERYTRKIEMELVSVDSFLESLETEKKQSVKEEIARRIFGREDYNEPKTEKE